MNIREFSADCTVVRLTPEDVPEILRLCQGNPLFYQHCPPPPCEESILRDMQALPPRKTMEDKSFLGFKRHGKLIAVLDLILRYPDEQTAFIGFFMVDSSLQGRGEGSRLIQDLFAAIKKDFRYVRLGYVKGNEQSRHFWHKNGLRETGVVARQPEYEIIYTQKEL